MNHELSDTSFLSPGESNASAPHSVTINQTNNVGTADKDNNVQRFDDLTDEEANRILWILVFLVTPTVSILGIVGNVFSIIILSKHGLRKCSNILLFSLAISDICFLIGFNSVAKMFYEFGRVKGFAMPYTSAYFMYILHNIFHTMDYGGGAVSFNIPVLITIERLVAVYLPLRFPLLITPKRTAFVVTCVYVFWFSVTIYTRVWFQFDYNDDNPYNISVGLIQRSQLFYEQPQVSAVIQGLVIYLCTTLPLPIVVVGCILIGIKVKLASMRRAKMTSSSSSSSSKDAQHKHEKKKAASSDMSRTTRTLVSVCAVYSVACLFLNVPQHMPQLLSYNLFADKPSNVGRVVYQLINLVVCINSSCNFLIYVLTNKKFRDTQKEILKTCFCYSSFTSGNSAVLAESSGKH